MQCVQLFVRRVWRGPDHCDVWMAVKKSVGKGVGKSVVKILKLLGDFPEITRESLAAEVSLPARGI